MRAAKVGDVDIDAIQDAELGERIRNGIVGQRRPGAHPVAQHGRYVRQRREGLGDGSKQMQKEMVTSYGVTLLVELNHLLPDETRATARQVVASVLADLERRLTDHTRAAVRGALARAQRARRPRPGDVDWMRTVHVNLRHYQPEYRTVIPEHLVGFGRRQRSLARDVVIAVDQSGSMADSVVADLFSSS